MQTINPDLPKLIVSLEAHYQRQSQFLSTPINLHKASVFKMWPCNVGLVVNCREKAGLGVAIDTNLKSRGRSDKDRKAKSFKRTYCHKMMLPVNVNVTQIGRARVTICPRGNRGVISEDPPA